MEDHTNDNVRQHTNVMDNHVNNNEDNNDHDKVNGNNTVSNSGYYPCPMRYYHLPCEWVRSGPTRTLYCVWCHIERPVDGEASDVSIE
ncbi:unnamed protein product [Cutaneotrichosporon oleaginosum]